MRARAAGSVLAAVLFLGTVGCTVTNPHGGVPKDAGSMEARVDGGSDAAETADLGGEAGRDATVEVGPEAPVGCLSDNDCRNDPGGPACDLASHLCVQCVTGGDCRNDPAGAACDIGRHVCVECVIDQDCRGDGGPSVCDTTAHACVGCLPADDPCDGTTPICDETAKACRACRGDSECTGGPHVCVGDGHCATDAETVYVQKTSSTCTSGGQGTAATPFCSTVDAVAQLATKSVIVVRGTLPVGGFDVKTLPVGSPSAPVLIVGQSGAMLAPGGNEPAGVHVSGTFDVTVRDLRITGSSVGIWAEMGARVHVNRCVVNDNVGGGILIDGASYDITNTIIAHNAAVSNSGGCIAWSGFCVQGTAPAGAPASRFLNDTVASNLGPGVVCLGNQSLTGSVLLGNGQPEIAGCNVAPCCGGGTVTLTSTYHLPASSPCADRLDPAMSVPDDVDGQARPVGALSDCGADEYQP